MSQNFQTSQDGSAFSSFRGHDNIARNIFPEEIEVVQEDSDDEEVQEVIHMTESQGLRKSIWTKAEDEVLINAFMEVTQDTVVHTNQKGKQLWTKVQQIFEKVQIYRESTESVRNIDKLNVRNIEQCRNRYKRLNAYLSKWFDAYEHASARRMSGKNEDDVIREAHLIYESNNSKKFQKIHVWDILKHFSKWQTSKHKTSTNEEANEESGGSAKRTKLREDGTYYPSSNSETPTSEYVGGSSLPPGIKSTKIKGKGKEQMPPKLDKWVDVVFHLSLTREKEADVEKGRLELEKKKEARRERKLNWIMCQSLLQKGLLSLQEEEIKKKLEEKLLN